MKTFILAVGLLLLLASAAIGALLTGIFATSAVNPILHDSSGKVLLLGVIEGNVRQLLNQSVGVLIA